MDCADTFKFTATNRYGRYDWGQLTMSAGRQPWGGNFSVSPKNGTTMSTKFRMETKDWVDDPDSLPLKWSFGYASATTGNRAVLRGAKSVMNTSTTSVPLGDPSDSYALVVDVRCIDIVGAFASLHETIWVKAPPRSQAASVVSAAVAKIDLRAVDASSVVEVTSTLGSAASLLNSVFDSVTDDGGGSGGGGSSGGDDGTTDDDGATAAAEALRDSIVTMMSSIVDLVEDSEGVESSATTLETITASSPESMGDETQVTLLGQISMLLDASSDIGTQSDAASSSQMSTMSNLVDAGILNSPINPSLVPTALPSRLPSMQPTPGPTTTPAPSVPPTPHPTRLPTLVPTPAPTMVPSPVPTLAPSLVPSSLPTMTPLPTSMPTLLPSPLPSLPPTSLPTQEPTGVPSVSPSLAPSPAPTTSPLPTSLPSLDPSKAPTLEPSPSPTITVLPSSLPTLGPTQRPTVVPSLTPTPLPTLDPTRAPSNAGQRRRRLRRHLLTTTAEQLDDALLTMNSAIGQNLVSGETNDVTSSNLGMRTSVIDSSLIGATGLSVGAATSSDSGLPSGFEPAMTLPTTFKLNSSVSVAAVNYGKSNPYEASGGTIAEGASVNAFTLNGVEVSGLSDPIVLSLPLPSSRRRRLGATSEWNGTWGSKDFAQSYSVNCGGTNVTKLQATYTSQDLARAQYCGTEHLLENMTEWVLHFEPWTNASKDVWCNSTEEWHYMDCEDVVGVLNYTCPVYYPVSTCTFWDTTTSTWSSDGCTYWRTDEVKGVAYCNCTHLTSFSSRETEALQSSTTTLAETTASVQDLSGKSVLKNIGVLVCLVSLWVLAGALFVYDRTANRFHLMKEHLSDEMHERYTVLTGRMFLQQPSVVHGNGEHGSARIEDELRAVHSAKGMLYSGAGTSQERASAEIEYEARRLGAHLKGQTRVKENWFRTLNTDNHLVALLNPESYRRENFTKRSVFLLSEVLSLLFVACLFAPFGQGEYYVCPADDTSGPGGLGGLLEIPKGLTFGELIWAFVQGELVATIINTLYLWPVGYLMFALYTLSARILKTRYMHETRLFELKAPRKLLAAFDCNEAIDLCVAANLLKSARHFLQRLSMIIRWRKKYLEWPLWVQAVMDNTCGLRIPQHHRLENHLDEMTGMIALIDDALDQIKDSIERLDGDKLPMVVEANEEAAADRAGQRAEARGAFVNSARSRDTSAALLDHEQMALERQRRSVRRHKFSRLWAWISGRRKAQKKARQQRAARASLPHEVQMSVIRREAMIESFEGKDIVVFRRSVKVPRILWSFVQWLKVFCFENFGGLEDTSEGALAVVEQMEKQQQRAAIIGSVYLVFATFFIFLTAVRLSDNDTIMSIMVTTFVVEGAYVAVVQPMEVLLTAAFLPALAAGIFYRDVTKHMQVEHREANRVRRFDARKRVVDPSEPFEFSPEWRKIESDVTFWGSERHVSAKVGDSALDEVRCAGPTRDRRVISTSWDLHRELQRHGVKCLRDLRNPRIVSKVVLADDLGLSEYQVEAFWRAVHGHKHGHKIRVHVAARRGLGAIVSNLFQGKRSPSGSPSGKAKPSSVFPVLSASEETSSVPEEKAEEKDDNVVSAAVMKLEQLRVSSNGGPNGGAGITSDAMTPRGVTELRSPTADNIPDDAPAEIDDALVAEPDAGPQVEEKEKPEVSMHAPTCDANGADAAPAEIDEALLPIEEWLDGLEQGYGAKYAHLFARHKVTHAGHLRNLSMRRLQHIISKLTDKKARRNVRAAMKGHLRSVLPENEEEARLKAEEEAAAAAKAKADAGARLKAEEETAAAAKAKAEEEAPIEGWLDGLKQGYGVEYAHLFAVHKVTKVRHLQRLSMRRLQDIVSQLTDKIARRNIRAAMKSHLRDVLPAAEQDAAAAAEVRG